MDEFIDLCILLGCDYCESIKGIGPKKALDLIREHKNIETILANLDTEKYKVPENWEFAEARELFKRPNVISAADEELVKMIRWEQPDVEGIVSFMVNDNGFKYVQVFMMLLLTSFVVKREFALVWKNWSSRVRLRLKDDWMDFSRLSRSVR